MLQFGASKIRVAMPPPAAESPLFSEARPSLPHRASVAFIGLGSNLGDRFGQLQTAMVNISNRIGAITRESPIYEAEPWGISLTPSPSYLNSVIAVETDLSPEAVLDILLEIEIAQGRQRPHPNAPRALDLDLLLYDAVVMDTPSLSLPHPRIPERRFVLQPLSDIAPDTVVPNTGRTVKELLERCTDELLVEPFIATDV